MDKVSEGHTRREDGALPATASTRPTLRAHAALAPPPMMCVYRKHLGILVLKDSSPLVAQRVHERFALTPCVRCVTRAGDWSSSGAR